MYRIKRSFSSQINIRYVALKTFDLLEILTNLTIIEYKGIYC